MLAACPHERAGYTCVYAPAFGKIVLVDRVGGHLAIFLSPMDVHRQYFPFDGHVLDVQHDLTGKFALAYELDKSNHNEKVIHTLAYGGDERTWIRVTQIAGALARRISYTHAPGASFAAGDELGVIHLGSRVDVYIPPDHGALDPSLVVGQKIKAGDLIGYLFTQSKPSL
jgi:phosphatidylserine decarboxylase